MAARKTRGTVDSPWEKSVRDKIKTSMLVNALNEHALGNKNMVATQIRAAEILLKKVIPDLSSVAAKVESTVVNETRLPRPKTFEELLTYVGAADRATNDGDTNGRTH